MMSMTDGQTDRRTDILTRNINNLPCLHVSALISLMRMGLMGGQSKKVKRSSKKYKEIQLTVYSIRRKLENRLTRCFVHVTGKVIPFCQHRVIFSMNIASLVSHSNNHKCYTIQV